MTIQTVYVLTKSKKALNDALAAGTAVKGIIHSMYGQKTILLTDLNDGDVIKTYEKLIGGSPYAKAYGNWDKAKGRVR